MIFLGRTFWGDHDPRADKIFVGIPSPPQGTKSHSQPEDSSAIDEPRINLTTWDNPGERQDP